VLNLKGQTQQTFPLKVHPLHQKQKTISHKEHLSSEVLWLLENHSI